MWHDLHCIAQEFTVWEKVGGSRQLGAPFVFSGCIHTHTRREVSLKPRDGGMASMMISV